METLAEKFHIIEGSRVHGTIDLDSLTNFPQPMFKTPEFVKYNGTRDPCEQLHMFCKKMAPYGDNHPLLCQNFPNSLTGHVVTWYVRLEKTSSWREIANSFLEYSLFNTEIAPDHTVLQRTEKKSKESFCEYA